MATKSAVAKTTPGLTPQAEAQASKELTTQMTNVKKLAAPLFNGEKMIFVISDQTEADLAGRAIQAISDYKKAVGSYWDGVVGAAHALHRSLTTKRKAFLDPADNLDSQLRRAVSSWVFIERRKAMEKQEELNKQAEEVGLPASLVEGPSVSGISASDTWTFRELDSAAKRELCKAIGAGKAPVDAIEVAESWLRKDVKQNHEKAVEDPQTKKKYLYPGVEIYETVALKRM